MLLGRPLKGTRAITANVDASTTSTVWRASLVKYSRVPSGADVTPCGTSMSWMTPAIVLVAGSIRWMLSPAALVWMMRVRRGSEEDSFVYEARLAPLTHASSTFQSGSDFDVQC